MTAQASTVWAQLAGLNAAAGSVVFIGADNATPVLDSGNFFYDNSGKTLFLGFAYNPAYTRYGANLGNGLVIEGMGNSYVAVNKQTATKYPGFEVASSNGSAQIPQYSTDGDLLGRFTGKAFSSSNPGSVQDAFNQHASLEMYADGSTGGVVPVTGNVGGKLVFKVKANGGLMQAALTIGQDLSAVFAGSFTVLGAIVFAGALSASAFIPTVTAAIPTIGMYSDVANNIDFAISSAKVVTWTSSLATFTQSMALTGTGYIQLPVGTTAQRPGAPAVGMARHNTNSNRNEFYEAGVWQDYARLFGDTFTGSLLDTNANGWKLVTGAASDTVPTLIPNQSAATTGFGAQASGNISAIVAGTEIGRFTATGLNNIIIGASTPLAATFTALTATGAIALSPANNNVVISPTGTGLVTINPATAGTLNNLVIGGTTPLAITGTTVTGTVFTGNRFIPNSNTVPTNGMYLPSANAVGFSTNSILALTLSATQTALFAGGVTVAVGGIAVTGASTFSTTVTNTSAANSWAMGTGNSSATNPMFIPNKGDLTTGISSQFAGNMSFVAGGLEQVRVTTTASAVNYIQLTGSVTTGAVSIAAGGTDGTIDLALSAKGATGQVVTNSTQIRVLYATAIPAGGTAGSGFTFSNATNFGMFFGSGAPALSAAKGSIYLRSDGSGVADRFYVNTNGATTWTNVVTAA